MQRRSLPSIAARLTLLESRQAQKHVIPLCIDRNGILEASDGRRFPSIAALMAATGQTRPPLVIGLRPAEDFQ